MEEGKKEQALIVVTNGVYITEKGSALGMASSITA